jgi:ABC-2 type transport system ATP-binding protein
MPILEMNQLTRRFGSLTAVDALTITVEPGEVFGLVGPNGAGWDIGILVLATAILVHIGGRLYPRVAT